MSNSKRSKVRNMRKKRMLKARKASEKNTQLVTNEENMQADEPGTSKSDDSEVHPREDVSAMFEMLEEMAANDPNFAKIYAGLPKTKLELLRCAHYSQFGIPLWTNYDYCKASILKVIFDMTGINSSHIEAALSHVRPHLFNNDKTNDVQAETLKSLPVSPTKQSSTEVKMNGQEKTREQIKAEREAKKAAKAVLKGKGKASKPEISNDAVSTSQTNLEPATPAECSKANVVEAVVEPVAEQLTTISVPKNKLDSKLPISLETKNDGKSKAELRAERRAKQEAQRAAKQGQVVEKVMPKTVESTKVPILQSKDEDVTKKVIKKIVIKENAHEVNLFKHLYHEREQSLISMPTVNSTIHPAIVRLGVQYADKVIVGSNARCVALLAAVKQLIVDFERPSQADFTRGLEATLQESSTYLHHCRPLAVSMHNALRHLKWQMTQLSATATDKEAKAKLGTAIDTYIQEQILLADKAISITIQTKISNGDVILTYGYSSLIYKILCDAYDNGRQFRVVVVDGRPWLEGREQLRRLAKHGLECSYVLINALSFIMPEVSKVFLGAHAILANGAVMSRVGTAQVALMAKAFNVPVLVACETHKTCERVQTDSIVYNEIADPDELAQNVMGNTKKTSLVNWRAKKSLNLLNITYDVTPADLVTAVVTELAILPCTSVPVILRIKPSEI